MDYYLVRAKWIDDKTDEFIRNSNWINGYKSKYISEVNNVKSGDILLLAQGSYIKYIGEVEKNYNDGHKLDVKWHKLQKPYYLEANGNYIKTFSHIKNKDIIADFEEIFCLTCK